MAFLRLGYDPVLSFESRGHDLLRINEVGKFLLKAQSLETRRLLE